MTAPGSSAAHTALINDILRAYSDGVHGKHGLVLWRQVTGTFLSLDGKRHVPTGIDGGTDLIGVRRSDGRFIAIECKTGKATLKDNQKCFRAMVLAMGGVYVEARCVEDVGRGLAILPAPAPPRASAAPVAPPPRPASHRPSAPRATPASRRG